MDICYVIQNTPLLLLLLATRETAALRTASAMNTRRYDYNLEIT
jgi:hypothetical protein